MRMKTIATFVLMTLFAAGLALVYTSTFAGGKRMATLTNVKGMVELKTADSTKWVEATERMVVGEGDEIKTKARSSAILKMDDGSMIKIGPLAKMKVETLSKSGRANRTSMGIEIGKTWNRVSRLGESDFNIRTPTAVAGVRGTYFSSEVEKTTDSTFDVYDGQVEVSSLEDPESAVMTIAGQRTQVAPGEAPTDPSAIPAGEVDADGFSDAEHTMATYDLQISVSPQVVTPGEKANVSIQVFKNGKPIGQEVSVKLSLSGSAKFVASGTSETELATDSQGSASVEITSSEKETVTVSAELRIVVQKQ